MDQIAPNHEVYEDELTKMRGRLEELYKEVHRKATQSNSSNNGGGSDFQLLQSSIEQRFADLEEKLNDKANKQSVAQALHRKANKPEVDALIAKKADLSDL